MKAEKIYAYITREDHFLVFEHTRFKEAGIQVPGGSVEEGETLDAAILREAIEETGLQELSIHCCLGMREFDLSKVGGIGIQHHHFFHLSYSGDERLRWRHLEKSPSDGSPAPIELELYWVKFPEGVPELIEGQGVLLNKIHLQATLLVSKVAI